jgi:TolA-binding protein
MKAHLLGLGAAALLLGCGETAPPPAKKGETQSNSGGNPLTAPVDYLGAAAKAKQTGVKVADLASVRQAIQVFQQEEDRLPKDLGELTAKQYLPALPAPPYKMKYQYNAANGEVTLVPWP